MTKKQCPLGEACDLTTAWMAGRQHAIDRYMEETNPIIDAQAAEIERLRGERDELEAMAIRAATIAQEQRARAEKALRRAEILVEAWYRCDDASFRHLMEEMRADVVEAKVAKT